MTPQAPDADPLFVAFVDAGLWPGVGRALAPRVLGSGVVRREQVTAARLAALPGVSASTAERLVSSLIGAEDVYDLAALLTRAGLPIRLAGRATAVLGPGAATRLAGDPWALLLLPDVGLAEADRLARNAGDLGPRAGLLRGRALVGWLLERAARDGHTAVPADELASQLAAAGVADPPRALADAAAQGDVLPDGAAAPGAAPDAPVAVRRLAEAEARIARGVARLLRSAAPLCDAAAVAAAADRDGLDAEQAGAVADALRCGVTLLTGGPGTGKSRTVGAMVRLALAGRKRVLLAAPTGRAAKRLEELSGIGASTLHRALGAQGREGTGFTRDRTWPLDADLVVVDETSMLDVALAAALLDACADGTHLVLVGDPEQLPSIGPGRVLADLLDVATAGPEVRPARHELITLYRQAEGGSIARLATAVRAGTLPRVEDPGREVVVVPVSSSGEAAHRCVQLVTDSIPRALGIPVEGIQVVTPVHRGPAGTQALNAVLKQQLNPGPGKHSGFDPGDRVVATANHLDDGFANGEIGTVVGAPASGKGVRVAFTGAGEVVVPPRAVHDLTLGWAVTVHRAQGSEWPAVVCVLPSEAATMLSRPLVYTAFTRAARHLSIVPAMGPALDRAVASTQARPRVTRLRSELEAALTAGDQATDAAPGRG
ncbi:MAG: putative ATP-dependent exoDNAse [Mycobacterium sp.]|nr:putative ATP-dependent exoDNAse [Mycobacterium sp.]